jgi:hypothetical protein
MMKSLRYAALAIGTFVLSSACDVEDIEDIEDVESIEEMTERAAALSCSAISDSTEVCIGDTICSNTDGHGRTSYQFMPAGGCPAGWTANPVDSVSEACGAANVLTDPPVCPAGCSGPATTTNKNASCCTKTKTCYDTPVVEPVDVEPVDVEPVDVEPVDVEPIDAVPVG